MSTDDNEQIFMYQIWDNTNWCRDTLTNPNSKYTQITLSHKYKTKEPNTNQKTKGSQIPNMNTKYQLHTNQRESHKANPKVATHQERANHQTAEPKPSGNKPFSLFQIATHKYQRTKPRESLFFSLTLKSFFLIFCSSTMLI